MEIMRTVAHSLQRLFGPELEELAAATHVIERKRKFDAITWLRTLVLSVLKHPRAKPTDFQTTAAQLGVHVSKAAILKRFSDQLVAFLRAVLERAMTRALAVEPTTRDLLGNCSAVFLGDGTSLSLPDAYAQEFPGCGGTAGAGRAALKVQVLWDFLTGALRQLVIEPGKSSDAVSPIAPTQVPAASLSLFDLGYFGLDRFGRLSRRGAFWISRLQIGTQLSDAAGREFDLLEYPPERFRAGERVIDLTILLGATHRLPCRLIAVRIPQEVAARRRQQAYEKAAKHGRTPSAEYLRWQDWTIFVTNCAAQLLTWKAVVVLYRVRWQIEVCQADCV